jgi:hypothetical protein
VDTLCHPRSKTLKNNLNKSRFQDLTEDDHKQIRNLISNTGPDGKGHFPMANGELQEMAHIKPKDLNAWFKKKCFVFVQLGHIVFDEEKGCWIKKGRLVLTDKGFKVVE